MASYLRKTNFYDNGGPRDEDTILMNLSESTSILASNYI